MNRVWLLALVGVVMGGCDSLQVGARPTNTNSTKSEAASVGPPDLDTRSEIVLVLWNHRLRVGDSSYEAQTVFPEKRNVLERNDLPAGLTAPYQARTWMSGDDGFGVILYERRVAAALAHFSGAARESLSELLSATEREMPNLQPQVINGRHTVYRFYEDGPHRLMICWFEDGQKTQLTVAMGDRRVLDTIGASPKAADQDSARVDDILAGKQKSE